jgi:HlyD family secretion protein
MSSILFDQQPETTAPPKVLNRRIIAWSVGGLLIAVVIALIAWRITHALAHKPGASVSAIPTVSVTEVGVSAVPSTVSIIGTIAARYDMPIGVEGDGGRVTAVYVEAGDHVKHGQALAHLNNSVLEPQVTNLEAALDQARAEAELAEAEYQRARAVGSSGAVGGRNPAPQVERCDRSFARQSCGGAAGRGQGAPRARRCSRTGRWHYLDAQCRGRSDGNARRRGLIPPLQGWRN